MSLKTKLLLLTAISISASSRGESSSLRAKASCIQAMRRRVVQDSVAVGGMPVASHRHDKARNSPMFAATAPAS